MTYPGGTFAIKADGVYRQQPHSNTFDKVVTLSAEGLNLPAIAFLSFHDHGARLDYSEKP
jgi:hypothetical protein